MLLWNDHITFMGVFPPTRNIFSHEAKIWFFSLLEMKNQQFFFKLNQKRPKKTFYHKLYNLVYIESNVSHTVWGATKVFTYLDWNQYVLNVLIANCLLDSISHKQSSWKAFYRHLRHFTDLSTLITVAKFDKWQLLATE